MNFSLYYRKNKNEDLFKTLEQSTCGLYELQNYVPLYEKFFSLNDTNYNSINLNQQYYLNDVSYSISNNVLNANISDNSNNIINKTIFCKFSPLLDPLKYLTGKYDISNNKIILPNYNTENKYPKLIDKNNSAYIDSFFTYLSSQLLHKYNVINSIDYYGAYIAKQKKFVYNIADDVDYLNESDYFHDHKDNYFSIDNSEHAELFNIYSRTNKKKLIINNKINVIDINSLDELHFPLFSSYSDSSYNDSSYNDSGYNDSSYNDSANNNIPNRIIDLSNACIFSSIHLDANTTFKSNIYSSHSSNSTTSSCSSKSSNTDNSDNNSDNVSDNDSDNDSELHEDISGYNSGNSGNDNKGNDELEEDSEVELEEDSDDELEEDIFCSIHDFPVQMIALEKCENTLDYLMENDLLSDKEWVSCLFQVIITLTIYQKVFSLTHNDLHTNNIMYINTEKQFLYYTFNNTTYKVPTYGKIYKIIDFGRSIYKFNNQIMCSDSFHPKGDAASQYNCEPYFDEKKPRLEPNYSFDLCRLACCLYDHFIEDLDDAEEIVANSELVSMINSWLIDDKQRNILYKNSGEERYPEFKLYKMIARTIHNAVPVEQLSNSVFKMYITSKKKLSKNAKIINIDKIPTFQ